MNLKWGTNAALFVKMHMTSFAKPLKTEWLKDSYLHLMTPSISMIQFLMGKIVRKIKRLSKSKDLSEHKVKFPTDRKTIKRLFQMINLWKRQL